MYKNEIHKLEIHGFYKKYKLFYLLETKNVRTFKKFYYKMTVLPNFIHLTILTNL